MSRYNINGIDLPGSTTIIDNASDKSGALMGWATRCMYEYFEERLEPGIDILDLLKESRFNYKDVSKKALDIGSELHRILELHVKDQIKGSNTFDIKESKPEVENGYLAFLEWQNKNIDTWLESEQTVFHETHLYGGTLDAIAKLKDGRIFCIDFKSSKAFYDGYGKQISSYKYAREGMNGEYKVMFKKDKDSDPIEFSFNVKPIKIDGVGVLRLDKETGLPEWKDYTKKYDIKIRSFLNLVDYYYNDKNRRLTNNSRTLKARGLK